MGNIVRVVTNSRVYSIGHRLPVPEGFPPEPFIISIIQLGEDENGGEVVEFVCTPDEDAAKEVGSPRPPEMTDEHWERLEQYRSNAKQAMDFKWMIVASIPRMNERIETLITSDEYLSAMAEEDDAPAPSVAEEPKSVDPEPVQEPEQPKTLPTELAVDPK